MIGQMIMNASSLETHGNIMQNILVSVHTLSKEY